jgi:hypothetical protein
VDLPSSLTTIYKNAFLYCPGLKSIEAENVQTVGKRAFEHCSSLHTLNLPQLREAGYNLVTDCANLHLLILPRVTNLNTGALDNIPRPEQVDLVFNAKMQSWLEARGISFKSVTYVAPETGLVTESNKEGVVADKPYTEQITIPYTE